MRRLMFGVMGLLFVAFALLLGGWAYLFGAAPPSPRTCGAFLHRPTSGWVNLTGCRFDVDETLVSGPDGVEALNDRAHGLSRALLGPSPRWSDVYVPVSTGMPGDARPVAVMAHLTDPDVLAWVNRIEAADEAGRLRLYEEPGVLLRLAQPGVLTGRTERSALADTLQVALGPRGRVGLLVLEPGPLPEREFPGVAVVLALIGLGLMSFSAFGGGPPRSEQLVDSGELELGALEALRREEAEARRQGTPPV